MSTYLISSASSSVPIIPVTDKTLGSWLEKQDKFTKAWVNAHRFKAAPGRYLSLPTKEGNIGAILLGVAAEPDLWTLAGLPSSLPQGTYRVEGKFLPEKATDLALGWLLGCYDFTRYRKERKKFSILVAPKGCDIAHAISMASATTLVRDLINVPAADMGPSALAAEAKKVSTRYKAKCTIIAGDALLENNYPTIHAVGRAAADAPHLIDIVWGNKNAPKVTLVGKGVTFDSGGLDIKSADNMRLMKKDMGGAAHVLALAQLIMEAKLNVRLRVLIPAVENSISGNAYRPGDVIRTRKGITVEVGNTDAEGRLVLCDALAEADTEKPDLLIDCSTLTGAARVALGIKVPALFSNNDTLAADLIKTGKRHADPLWQLPMVEEYRANLDSRVADIQNVANHGYAGAILAALFLKEFVPNTKAWAHLDMMAWNTVDKPGRPAGGEAMGLRAMFALIQERFG